MTFPVMNDRPNLMKKNLRKMFLWLMLVAVPLAAAIGTTTAAASEAEPVICEDSGQPFPLVENVDLTSSAVTGFGHTVETTLSVTGGVRPLTIVSNFIKGHPHHRNTDLIHTSGIIEGDETSGLTTGIVPGTISHGDYETYNVVVADAAGCVTLYYLIGPNTLEYQPAPVGLGSQIHFLDLDQLALTVTSDEQAPPDILNPINWTHDQRYRNKLAMVFYDRPATASELGSLRDLSTQENRLQMTRNMAGSQEWASRVVDDIYQAALDRPADYAGRAYWAERLWVDGTTRDIAVAIYGSPEAFNAAGGSNEAFVTGLYNRILERDPDPDGLAFWRNLLDSGQAEPTDLVAAFWESIEFRRQRVSTVYLGVLGRYADPGGHAYWAEQLFTTDDVQLAALLAASDEFYKRTGP